jgi:hypothetical protein
VILAVAAVLALAPIAGGRGLQPPLKTLRKRVCAADECERQWNRKKLNVNDILTWRSYGEIIALVETRLRTEVMP